MGTALRSILHVNVLIVGGLRRNYFIKRTKKKKNIKKGRYGLNCAFHNS